MMKRESAVASYQGAIRVRGVPFSCTEDDLKSFFKDLDVVEIIFGKDASGRSSGEAYVWFGSEEDAEKASNLSGQYLRRRYLEIFNISNEQFDKFKKSQSSSTPMTNPVIRGGMGPFDITNSDDSWTGFVSSPPLQSPVNFSSSQHSYQHRGSERLVGGKMWNPYEAHLRGLPLQSPVYLSSYQKPLQSPVHLSSYQKPYPSPVSFSSYQKPYQFRGSGRMIAGENLDPYQIHMRGWTPQSPVHFSNYQKSYQLRGSGRIVGGEILNPFKVHMRGLPYRVTAKEIEHFFAPLQLVEIKTGLLEDGRASGDGIVEFNNEADARDALTRDKENIKNRYIELFSHDNAKISARTTYKSIWSRHSSC